MRLVYLIPLIGLLTASCYQRERNCTDFKTGQFEFRAEVNGQEMVSTFVRTATYEIETFEGKVDTSSIRWVNDCEYIVQKLHPKNMAEKKAVHMKILTTKDNSYEFEFGIVGDANKGRGTLVKTGE